MKSGSKNSVKHTPRVYTVQDGARGLGYACFFNEFFNPDHAGKTFCHFNY